MLDNKIDVLINTAGVTSDNLSIRIKEEDDIVDFVKKGL